MTLKEFVNRVVAGLGYTPNEQQQAVIEALARFCSPSRQAGLGRSADRVFLLNGYAGTGKTSLTGALVRALHSVGISTVLLAPTGRAAKVFGSFAGFPAYTIHRRIYRHSLNGERPGLQQNNSRNTVFIVDEASMIGDNDEVGGSLLEDLVQYVFAGENCSLIFLGDTAQLPPVGTQFSPAMDAETLRRMGLTVSRATLTAVARQSGMSGILANATWMRRAMRQPEPPLPKLFTDGLDDVRKVTSEAQPEIIDAAYRRDGMDQPVIVTRSNRRAADFNRGIRAQVLYLEEELAQGELILVAHNNYFWSKGVKELDFIANGDVAVVDRVFGTESRYGMRFADVRLTLVDRPDVSFDAKVMLNTLANDYAALGPGELEKLYQAITSDPELFAPDTPYEMRNRQLRTNPYWNALRVKYAYAVTCHKAQGGQWQNVFVDMGYIPPEAMGLEFYRWRYTATTRARQNLYFANPDEQ